jgi:hypothetical protein
MITRAICAVSEISTSGAASVTASDTASGTCVAVFSCGSSWQRGRSSVAVSVAASVAASVERNSQKKAKIISACADQE